MEPIHLAFAGPDGCVARLLLWQRCCTGAERTHRILEKTFCCSPSITQVNGAGEEKRS